jgi:Ser/Thr protein kinase RdoA (MazF antagonist)
VIELLRHLHRHGFPWAPEPVGTGFAADGRERLTFIEGRSPQPAAWSDDAVRQIGSMLRRLHDVAVTFQPKEAPTWRPWFGRHLAGSRPVIGHGDLGPWNVLARDGMPVAFIDWDNAGPVDAYWELAQVAWLNAQLHDDDVAERNGLQSPETRARQLAILADGYELPPADRAGLVDRMVEFAVRAAREEAVAYQVGPDTTSPASDGFPIVWAIAWRARGAAWMLDHRTVLERALHAS